MHGRVRNLPRIGLSQQRRVVIFLLSLAGSLFFSSLAAEAKSDYEIINTGIKGGGCWLDDQRFVVEQRVQRPGSQGYELEGLYYLNPNKPKQLVRIDLSPIEPPLQKQIRDVTCQDENVLFHVLTADRKGNQLYILKIGHPPVLLAEKTKGFVIPRAVSTKNRYVLGFTSALKERGAQRSATPEEARADCPFAYLHPQYRVVCLRHDRGNKQTWLANNTFLTQYLWDETIRVTKDGQHQWVPNPEPPLRLPNETELKQGYILRDLENRIVQEIPTKQGSYKIDAISIKPNPGGTYLYARCSKMEDYDPPKTFYGRMCRFNLGGEKRQWDEVFSVQKEPNEQASLHDFDINDSGDVLVMRRAKHARPTVWKYGAHWRSVEQLPTGLLSQEIGTMRLAPGGSTISYATNGQLVLVQLKEEQR